MDPAVATVRVVLGIRERDFGSAGPNGPWIGP